MSLEGIAFALGFFTLLVMAFVRHPRFGLYAYMAAYYVHPPSRWWGGSMPDLRWALLAAAVTFIAIKVNSKKFDQSRSPWQGTFPARVLIVMTIWIWIQNLWALSPEDHMELSILYTKYVLLFYLIYRIADTPKEVSEILLVHVIGCFYLGYLAYGANSSGRLEGVGGPDINEANALGMQLATSVMCGAMVVLLQRGWRWVVCAAAMPFVLNGLVLTGSRGAFLSVVAGGLVLTLMRPKKNSKRFYALSALALVAFGYVANEAFWQRMGTMNAAVDSQQQMDTSAESRFVIMEAQVRMAALHPLGTGHRGTVELSREFIAEKYLTVLPDGSVGQRSSHNTFMTAWVEQGVPGAIMFICIVGWCFSTGLKVRRRYRGIDADVEGHCAAICASLAVFFLAGVFVDYLKNEIQIWMFALLAALASLEKPVQPAR